MLNARLDVVARIQSTLRETLVARVKPTELMIVLALVFIRLTDKVRLLDVALCTAQFLTIEAPKLRLVVICTR